RSLAASRPTVLQPSRPMRVVEQTSDRLVLHQSAWGFRGMGAFIGALGSGVVALSWQGRRGVESGAAIGYVVGGAFALVGIGVLLTAADLRVVFDRFAKTARL